jgi:hypothetical protein
MTGSFDLEDDACSGSDAYSVDEQANAVSSISGFNLGEGVCAELGFQSMTVPPEAVDWKLSEKGGMLFIAPLKDRVRAREKVERQYDSNWSKLLDLVRCTIAVDTWEEIRPLIRALMESGMKLACRPKDRFAEPLDSGYRDLWLNIVMANGHIAEMQIHLKKILEAKAKTQPHYEIERVLGAKAEAGTITDTERSNLRAAISKQIAIYRDAWSDSCGGPGKIAKPCRQKMEYDYFSYDNATFRRARGGLSRMVSDVFSDRRKIWLPYTRDRLAPAVYGDPTGDPLDDGAAG